MRRLAHGKIGQLIITPDSMTMAKVEKREEESDEDEEYDSLRSLIASLSPNGQAAKQRGGGVGRRGSSIGKEGTGDRGRRLK